MNFSTPYFFAASTSVNTPSTLVVSTASGSAYRPIDVALRGEVDDDIGFLDGLRHIVGASEYRP